MPHVPSSMLYNNSPMAPEGPDKSKLFAAASQEAAQFVLPEDWRVEREKCWAIALDDHDSRAIDDAVLVSESLNSITLHGSIADTGSFWPQLPSIARYARRRAWTRYRDGRAVIPMIPREISEDKLSLLDDEERPALTVHIPVTASGAGMPELTRDVLQTKRVSYEKVEEAMRGEDDVALALRGLKKVAAILFAARHLGKASRKSMILEDEEGYPLDHSHVIGRLIAQECMLAIRSGMGQFAYANSIPVLYRNHVIPDSVMPEITDPEERVQLLRPWARVEWATEPKGHIGLGMPMVVPFSSPLRSFPDFVNHANVVAHYVGNDYPYPQPQLRKIAAQLERLAAKQSDPRTEAIRRASDSDVVPAIAPPYRRCGYLLRKFTNQKAGPSDIATALFGAVGTETEVVAVRLAAANYAAQHVNFATQAIKIARDRQHLILRLAQDGETGSGNKLVVEDLQGNVYPYPTSKYSADIAAGCVRLIGRICDVEVEPLLPPDSRRENEILRDGYRYLRSLAKQRRIQLGGIRLQALEEGRQRLTLRLDIGGRLHIATAEERSKGMALRRASAQLITEHDLINNPPPAELWRKPGADPEQSPCAVLGRQQSRADLPDADYVFLEDSGEGWFVCKVSAIDITGKWHRIEAGAFDKESAKQRAAAGLLERQTE